MLQNYQLQHAFKIIRFLYISIIIFLNIHQVLYTLNNYYQILDQDNSIKLIYKGTEIQVFENVLTKKVKVKYYNIFYETKK